MIIALHGFLGTPRDWDFLRDAGMEIRAIDLFHPAIAGDVEEVERHLRGLISPSDTLLGYSMGGRLALEMLARRIPCGRAVIVSAGLNLEDEKERDARRERDDAWARRFEKDEWRQLMSDWNAQPVFGGASRVRTESEFDRAMLARALRGWSPGVLSPLSPRLASIEMPALWVAGERDAAYVHVAERAVALLPDAQLWICRDAGHRVPWEAPSAFVEKLREWGQV